MSAARDIHVGTPAADFPLEEKVTVHFHDFENLTVVKDDAVVSPAFTCAGNEWSLRLYPGGDSDAIEGKLSVCLWNESPAKIDAWFDISIIKNDGVIYQAQSDFDDDKVDTFEPGYEWGWSNFISRSEIVEKSNNILKMGTLTFLVHIKPTQEYYCLPVKPQLTLTLGDNISELYVDEDTADVAFSVCNSIFHAHKVILQAQAPELLELAEQFNVDSPMIINDVEPVIFAFMLGHVYGIEIHACDWKKHSKQILVAAGKYGFSVLKTEAEAWHVKNLNLTIDNAVDELLYADGTHCLDLKKASIQFIVENGEGVLASDSYAKLYESPELMKNVMMELAKSNSNKKRKLDELSPCS